MNSLELSPKQLDEQSIVHIHRWVDVYSEECRMMDDDHKLTCHIMKLGFQEPPFLFTDSDGRVWGKGESGRLFPFHMEYGAQLIGFRLIKKASN